MRECGGPVTEGQLMQGAVDSHRRPGAALLSLHGWTVALGTKGALLAEVTACKRHGGVCV